MNLPHPDGELLAPQECPNCNTMNPHDSERARMLPFCPGRKQRCRWLWRFTLRMGGVVVQLRGCACRFELVLQRVRPGRG